ncbi:FimV/HubP family polar landmark protein [Halomonas sp. H10-9-1]|uniref:FimV/HubP family polar landmark protein n=1 Tax=Halomonas sp. H10-9-1 TaxID=2950871 RepID=UPI0032DFA132
MKRKLTLAMLLSLSATSPIALALGLGEAEVRSTLNAPLRASVPLVDAAGIQPGLLNVAVADERAYAAAGFTRTPLAASVRLSVVRRQGRLFVDLTTERPVREPWLDLLLRFDWPTGRQVREVTLLLDPPNYAEMPALVNGSRRVAATAAALPSDRQPTSAAAPSPRPAASVNRDPAWVRSGDTLWGVAGRLRPDSGISMNQMMVALVAANPEAFPSGNINAMRAGVTLAVPERAAIATRSEADADRIVSAMNRAWANRGSGAPARVALGGTEGPEAAASVVASAPEASSQDRESVPEEGEIAASSEQGAGQGEPLAADRSADEAADEPRLTLLTDAQLAAEQVLAAEAGDAADAGVEESEAAAEELDAAEQLSERVDGDASARIEIDPEWLAALYGEGELDEERRLLHLENRWQQSQAQLETVQAERDELQQELGDIRDELAVLRDQLATLTAGGSGADAPSVGGLDAAPGDEQETPWWGGLYPGELDRNLVLGGSGLAALLALWLAIRRRRGRDEEASSAEVRTVRVGTPGAASPVRPSASTAGGSPVAEASPGVASVRASLPQAEAINEADIFIAYGRYDQARDLLEASLAREPERDDLRLKLLGVHLEQGSREAAERELAILCEGGNPAVIDEAEGLMARHGLSVEGRSRVDSEPRGERADFGEAAAFPPRRFDVPSDAERASPLAMPSTPREATAFSDAVQELGRESESSPGREPSPDGEPSLDRESSPERASGLEPAVDEAAPLPEVATRRLDDGREVIDYRPPSLDASAPTRTETPMQPSVDFTSEGLGVARKGAGFGEGEGQSRGDAGGASERSVADGWEVEEVSFPPLQADNERLSASAAERLAETHRLVETGESGRARELLDELSRSDDPAIRDEALALLRRLDA